MSEFALGKHFEEFIRKQLESGRYETVSEVVREGLRLLEDQDALQETWLNETIPARFEEIKSNPDLAVPAETVRARFEAKRRANDQS